MSERARKAGQFAGAVERLAVELAMVEIIQARRFLGKPTSKKDREELLKLTTPELASAAQALGAAVHLRQQMEIAEFTRGLIISIHALCEEGDAAPPWMCRPPARKQEAQETG